MGFLLLVALVPVLLAGVLSGGDDAPASSGTPEDEDGILRGDEADNTIAGGAGDQLIAGFNGDDLLSGGAGIDFLVGDNGADSLAGDAGNDVLLGGAGDDQLAGGDGVDLLVGGAGADLLVGEAGDDLLVGMGGTDTLNGGAGNDVLIGITPNPANPEALLDGLDPTELGAAIEGRYGAISDPFETRILRNLLSIDTSESATQMIGGDGDDTLLGDRGDEMTGGAGADSFSALTPPLPDDPTGPDFGTSVRITDFEPGVDTLEVIVETPGAVDIQIAARDQGQPEGVDTGLIVQVNGVDVAYLAGLQLGDLTVDDILLTRV